MVCCTILFKAVELCWIISYQNEMRASTLFLSFMITCAELLQIREQADSCWSNLNFYLRGKHSKPDYLCLLIFSYFPGFSWVFPFQGKLKWHAWHCGAKCLSCCWIKATFSSGWDLWKTVFTLIFMHYSLAVAVAVLLPDRFLTSHVRNLWQMICRAFLLGQQFANTLSKVN